MLIGLWFGGFFERYVFNFRLAQNFSIAELRQLKGKAVKEVCGESQTKSEKRGIVTGYSSENYLFLRVGIKWDNSEEGFSTNYPKDYFSKCIEVSE